ncbi:MAG: hypothetical protein OFPI_21930 [Osedax symbiont Rs2]|nr:MAG: hypothetical protein OFPI_21930 [Osedax symbiont Rs2]
MAVAESYLVIIQRKNTVVDQLHTGWNKNTAVDKVPVIVEQLRGYCSIRATMMVLIKKAPRPNPSTANRMIVPNLPALDFFAKS